MEFGRIIVSDLNIYFNILLWLCNPSLMKWIYDDQFGWANCEILPLSDQVILVFVWGILLCSDTSNAYQIWSDDCDWDFWVFVLVHS